MYAELESKTNYSFLNGASHPEELVTKAVELGLPALGINDFDGVYGIPKAYWQKKKFPQLKLLVGASLNLELHPRITVIARDRKGYGTLCRMLSASHAGKEKGQAVLSFAELQEKFSLTEGLFFLLPADADLARILPLLRPDRTYLKIHRFLDGFDREREEKCDWLSRRWRLPLVATNDVYFHVRERKKLHDVLIGIHEGKPLQKLGHKLFPNSERVLKSPREMAILFRDRPEALANTLKIAEDCRFCPSELRYRYPSEWIPSGQTAQSYLRTITLEGAKERYPRGVPIKVREQIEKELKIIADLGFADYFLTIYDIIEFAKRKDILYQGRGSAANSAICYCIGITAIDPSRSALLFERFISAERGEPPDIDVDFAHERREEVIQYIYEKYGRDRAAMVSAVITYQKRSAFREVAKTLDVEVGTLSAKQLERDFDERAKRSETRSPRELVDEMSEEISGFPRHLSIHSGGFTLSADPIIEIVPVEPARMDGRTIIQWDKYDLDYLGLLKVDVLSLGMLSAIDRVLKMTGMKLYEVPAEDKDTYAMIQRADTVGTFQIESRAQISMLGRLQPKNFYDLVIEVAIMRPGPIVGNMIHPYLRRRRGQEKVDFPHPKLEAILGRTLGVPIFQEQVMQMAMDLAGFTPGEADRLRRAIGAWRSSGEIQEMGQRLMRGLRGCGLSEAYANQIFQQIQGFAHYGFPESHAASFALLAYVSSYLKCHHPAEFLCGLLNSQPMGFYAAHTLIDDAKRHGVHVEPIHPELSSWETVMEGKTVRLGWRLMKGLHRKEADRIVANRPYPTLKDFLHRTNLRKEILMRLAIGDGFSCYGLEPRAALWEVLECHKRSEPEQGDLFLDFSSPPVATSTAKFKSQSEYELIHGEYKAFSLAVRGHPMQALRKELRLPKLTTSEAKKKPNGSILSLSGLILVRQRPPTAKGMTFSTLEDEFGYLDVAIPPPLWEKQKTVFLENCFLTVRGKFQVDGNSYSLLAQHLASIWPETSGDRLEIEPSQYFW